jgi:CRISPR-associated protein Csm1
MDPTVLKISAAALLHDIGKFADRAALEVSEQYMQDHADLYQPFKKDVGRHTHPHAVYTAAFIERLKDMLPSEFSARQWGEGESLINLAAGHHRPEDNPLRWIITEADRLSSGWERYKAEIGEEGPEVDWREYRKTRLSAILADLSLPQRLITVGTHRTPNGPLGYALRELSPANIFPHPLEEVTPADGQAAKEEYLRLFHAFRENLALLAHRDTVQLWLEHFDSLLMTYTALIPALRAGEGVETSRDVSLYDHARTTAALATALYLYHRDNDSLTVPAIKSSAEKKFLFISGDFYGIQDFISSAGGETRRYRAKLLRGRSFAVSLITELAADLVCRKIGLPFLSVVLNAAGKFTILSPNTEPARQALKEAEEEINEWLFDISIGENALGLAYREGSPDDLRAGRFVALWEQIGQDLERKKLARLDLHRFGGKKDDYLDRFRTTPPLCQLCGKRPGSPEVAGDQLVAQVESVCAVCRDHVFLGTHLVKRERLLAVTPATASLRDFSDHLREPILGRYQVVFSEGSSNSLAQAGHLLKLWDISLLPTGSLTSSVTRRFLNGYVPACRPEDLYDDRLQDLEEELEPGAPKTLSQLAALALSFTESPGKFQGLEALGVLKADVDDLGLLMTCGLPEAKFTLSRLATMSRQLHFFFCVHLPYLLMTEDRFENTYTVFAGGDDLFLIGPWNRIIELAREIRERFGQYVGANPEVHLSTGISLQKPHTPLDQLAYTAEEALREAKAVDQTKNRLALFGETVSWNKIDSLIEVGKTLKVWLEVGWFTPAMLHRLNEFIRLAGEAGRLTDGRPVHLDDLGCLKWPAHLAYFTARNVARNLKGEEREQAVNEVHENLHKWLKNFGGALKMPLWELLYERRKS